MAELTLTILYCMCAVIEVILMCINHKFYGDVEIAKYNISFFQAISYFVLFFIVEVNTYYFYKYTRSHKGKQSGIKCIVSSKMNYFFLGWVLIYLTYTAKTGVGIVGRNAVSAYSAIFSMFDINVVFPFYYVLFRENKKDRKLFVINVVLYCVLRLMQGWTGFIVGIFTYELYFISKKKRCKASFLKGVLIAVAILIGGAYVYKILYPLKMSVRFNYKFTWALSLPYSEALSKLTSRFSDFCRGTYALFNMEKIRQWYTGQNKILIEIQDILRPILPRKIMSDKEFMSLCGCIFAAAGNQKILGSSSSPGIIPYSIMLFYSDPFSAIIWSLLYIGYFFIMRKTYSMLETKSNNQMDILYFGMLHSMISTGSLSVLFSIQYLKLIFIVPLLYICKIIKFRKLKIVKTSVLYSEIIFKLLLKKI